MLAKSNMHHSCILLSGECCLYAAIPGASAAIAAIPCASAAVAAIPGASAAVAAASQLLVNPVLYVTPYSGGQAYHMNSILNVCLP